MRQDSICVLSEQKTSVLPQQQTSAASEAPWWSCRGCLSSRPLYFRSRGAKVSVTKYRCLQQLLTLELRADTPGTLHRSFEKPSEPLSASAVWGMTQADNHTYVIWEFVKLPSSWPLRVVGEAPSRSPETIFYHRAPRVQGQSSVSSQLGEAGQMTSAQTGQIGKLWLCQGVRCLSGSTRSGLTGGKES